MFPVFTYNTECPTRGKQLSRCRTSSVHQQMKFQQAFHSREFQSEKFPKFGIQTTSWRYLAQIFNGGTWHKYLNGFHSP